jgi:hypothetical protein
MTKRYTPDEITEALQADPIRDAETIVGKRWNEADRDTFGPLALGLSARHADVKERMLKSVGDTTFLMSLADYVAVVERAGFVNVLNEPFTDPKEPNRTESYMVFYRSPGQLLCFDTYWSRATVNRGKVHYAWNPTEEAAEKRWAYRLTSSGYMTKDGIWCGDHDCREALLHNLSRLAEHGEFVEPWPVEHQPWLLSYADHRGYDDGPMFAGLKRLDELSNARLARLPANVVAALGLQPRQKVYRC